MIGYDEVLCSIVSHITHKLSATSCSVRQDRDSDVVERAGGGLAVDVERLVSVTATIRFRVPSPMLPDGYSLVFRSDKVHGRTHRAGLLLFGPDIDRDDPESIERVLELDNGEELLRSLLPIIDDAIDGEDRREWTYIKDRLSASVHEMAVVFDADGKAALEIEVYIS